MAASYIEALIPCEEFGFRWNASGYPAGTDGIGDGVTLSFSFMIGPTPPAHYTAGVGDAFGFAAFTAAQEAAARAVLGLIADVADITFTDLGNANTGQILLGRNDNTSGAAAYAYYPSEHSQKGGDVWVDRDLYTSSDLAPGERGFSTLIHEIGHALGLKHSFEADDGADFANGLNFPDHGVLGAQDNNKFTVMSYTAHPNGAWVEVDPGGMSATKYDIEPSTPLLYDIAALQYLYGKNMTTRTGNDIYEFDPDTPFIQCIWDAGGNDTISVLDFMLGCTVNLTAGQFSSIKILSEPFGSLIPSYDGTDNLSIAFGCTIENATGGSGNDRLTGNSVKNTLTGNDGNDTLDGGNGNDVLNGGSGRDRFAGGAGNDKLMCESTDTRIDGGVGTGDVLDLASGSLDILPTRIKNIEIIDLRGGGANTVTLDKADIVAISSTDKLKIMGDSNDTVNFTGTLTAPTGVSLKLYDLGGGVQLSVESDVLVVV